MALNGMNSMQLLIDKKIIENGTFVQLVLREVVVDEVPLLKNYGETVI